MQFLESAASALNKVDALAAEVIPPRRFGVDDEAGEDVLETDPGAVSTASTVEALASRLGLGRGDAGEGRDGGAAKHPGEDARGPRDGSYADPLVTSQRMKLAGLLSTLRAAESAAAEAKAAHAEAQARAAKAEDAARAETAEALDRAAAEVAAAKDALLKAREAARDELFAAREAAQEELVAVREAARQDVLAAKAEGKAAVSAAKEESEAAVQAARDAGALTRTRRRGRRRRRRRGVRRRRALRRRRLRQLRYRPAHRFHAGQRALLPLPHLRHRGLGRAAETVQVVQSRARVSLGADLRRAKRRIARRHAHDDVDAPSAEPVPEQFDRHLQRGHGV